MKTDASVVRRGAVQPWVIHFINARFESKCDGRKFVTISLFSWPAALLTLEWSFQIESEICSAANTNPFE